MSTTDHSVTLGFARTQTSNWREYYAEIYNAYPQDENVAPIRPDGPDTFRGFKVALEDLSALQEIIEKINTPNNTNPIDSIRIYLAKHSPQVMPGGNGSDTHVILVPVTKDGKDMCVLPTGITFSVKSPLMDYTTPCPDQCDISSVLYR